MPTRDRLVYDEQAQDVLERLPLEESRSLKIFLKSLAEHPFRTTGHQTSDAVGRPNEVEVFGRMVITYWADHAVCELRVAALEFY